MISQTDLREFTVEEANRSVDDLKKTLRALRGLLRTVEKMESRLEILELICNRSVTSNNSDLKEYLALKLQYHAQISKLEHNLLQMKSEGYLLQDLANGVVHFIAKRGPEHVLLCWKEGEKDVSHWHSLKDDGFLDEDERLNIENWDDF